MTERTYTPPKVWEPNRDLGGVFGQLNSCSSGPRFVGDLPRGLHPLQLYSQGTPNGQKVTIMLEELLAHGVVEAEYDAHLWRIIDGAQFSSEFTAANPNSKIPLLIDHSGTEPLAVFESGSILVHLAERFGYLLPTHGRERASILNWLFWLHGAAPYIGGGFGHFYAYAPYPMKYPLDRYTMETKRLFDVLDRQLAQSEYVAGNTYSIADIAIFPWFGGIALDGIYGAYDFLSLGSYTHVLRWASAVAARTAVQRGMIVNSVVGPLHLQLHSRHASKDIDDCLEARRKSASDCMGD